MTYTKDFKKIADFFNIENDFTNKIAITILNWSQSWNIIDIEEINLLFLNKGWDNEW